MIINGLEVFHDHDDMRGIPLNCIRININEIENMKDDNYSVEDVEDMLTNEE